MPGQAECETPLLMQQEEQQEILELYQKIQRSRAKLVGPDGKTHRLPNSLYSFLLRLIADLKEGKSVAIVQNETVLTTVEASSMLGVSRQFFVNLLNRGEILHHMVGTHRRAYVRDILAYKAKRDAHRRKVLDDLVQAEVNEGIYDAMPPRDADTG